MRSPFTATSSPRTFTHVTTGTSRSSISGRARFLKEDRLTTQGYTIGLSTTCRPSSSPGRRARRRQRSLRDRDDAYELRRRESFGPGELLGRHVVESADGVALRGEAVFLQEAARPEIEERDVPVVTCVNVLGLEVAVNGDRMDRGEASQDRDHDLERPGDRHSPAEIAHQLAQGPPDEEDPSTMNTIPVPSRAPMVWTRTTLGCLSL